MPFDVDLIFADDLNSFDRNEKKIRSSILKIIPSLKKLPEWRDTTDLLGRELCHVEIYFCGDLEMRAFQKRYKKLNRTTDVLSFANRDSKLQKGAKQNEKSLGSMVISLPTIARHAKHHHRKIEEELFEVLIHSFLHLLGFEHVRRPKERAHMMRVQEALFLRHRKAIQELWTKKTRT